MHYTTQRRRNTASLLTPLISLLLLLVMTSCFGKTGGKKKGGPTSLKEEDVPEITPGKLVLKRAGDTMTIVNEGTGPVDLNKHYLTTKSLTVKDYDDKDLDAKNYRIAYVKPAGGKTSISGKTPVSMLMGAGSGIQIGGATAALLKAKEEVTFTVQLSDYTNVGSASMEFCLTDEQGKEIGKEKVDWKAKLKITISDSDGIAGTKDQNDPTKAEVKAKLTIKNISTEEIDLKALKSSMFRKVVDENHMEVNYDSFQLHTTQDKLKSGEADDKVDATFVGLPVSKILGPNGSPKTTSYYIAMKDQSKQILGYYSFQTSFEESAP